MSHLAAIGLHASTPEELERTVGRVFEHTRSLEGPSSGQHPVFSDPSGAALAIHLGPEQDIECVTPFFSAPGGGSVWRVRTAGPHVDRDCLHCSGADCDVLGAAGVVVTRASIQWLHFEAYRSWLTDEREYDLEIAGFASSLEIAGSPIDLDRDRDKDPSIAQCLGVHGSQAMHLPANDVFLPYGIHGHEGDLSSRARALLTGPVIDFAIRTNRFSGLPFAHLRLATLAGDLDVVAPSSLIREVPASAAHALADVWLVGRPAAPAPVALQKNPWWRRMIGTG